MTKSDHHETQARPGRRTKTLAGRPATVRLGVQPALAEDGLLVMDSSLTPIAADRGAIAILSSPQQGAGRAQTTIRLPKELEELSKEHNIHNLPAAIQFHAGNAVYTCRVFVIHSQNADPGQSMVALYFKQGAYVGNSIARVAALYHLTVREQQALEGIAAGLTSKEIAAGMNISPNTVKSFLRIIMLKMNVATRVGLVGKLLEDKDDHGSGNDFTRSTIPPPSELS
jgi:DNA-binding CsgD family transcriptional regulator